MDNKPGRLGWLVLGRLLFTFLQRLVTKPVVGQGLPPVPPTPRSAAGDAPPPHDNNGTR